VRENIGAIERTVDMIVDNLGETEFTSKPAFGQSVSRGQPVDFTQKQAATGKFTRGDFSGSVHFPWRSSVASF
jgi:hypothetical protein